MPSNAKVFCEHHNLREGGSSASVYVTDRQGNPIQSQELRLIPSRLGVVESPRIGVISIRFGESALSVPGVGQLGFLEIVMDQRRRVVVPIHNASEG